MKRSIIAIVAAAACVAVVFADDAPKGKRINRAIELLADGQPIYYTGSHEGTDGNFEQGCHVRNIQSRPWPMSDLETTLEVDRMIPGKELTIRCMDTGTYCRSVLTEGQGGTFIEMEAGNDPKSLKVRLQVAAAGERMFRRWVEHALEKLRGAAEAARAPG